MAVHNDRSSHNSGHRPKKKRRNSAMSRAFKEVFDNPPKTVDKSKSKEGQRKQKVAIALSKVRRRKR